MDGLVEVRLPVGQDVADVLADPAMRDEIGRFVTDMIRARAETDPLLRMLNELGAEAVRRGLTQEILDEELAAYNAERRTAGRPVGRV